MRALASIELEPMMPFRRRFSIHCASMVSCPEPLRPMQLPPYFFDAGWRSSRRPAPRLPRTASSRRRRRRSAPWSPTRGPCRIRHVLAHQDVGQAVAVDRLVGVQALDALHPLVGRVQLVRDDADDAIAFRRDQRPAADAAVRAGRKQRAPRAGGRVRSSGSVRACANSPGNIGKAAAAVATHPDHLRNSLRSRTGNARASSLHLALLLFGVVLSGSARTG